MDVARNCESVRIKNLDCVSKSKFRRTVYPIWVIRKSLDRARIPLAEVTPMTWLDKNMNSKTGKNWLALSLFGISSLFMTATQAAIVDGAINSINEYQWNTTTPPNSKWETRKYWDTDGEVNDGSGRDRWDINYLGTDIDRSGGSSKFHFGAKGGSILSGSNMYGSNTMLTLGDIAINVVEAGESPTDPAADSTGWDYALRLMDIKDGIAEFKLFSLLGDDGDQPGVWQGSGTGADDGNNYNHQNHAYGSTETYKMMGGHEIESATPIQGKYSPNSGDHGVLEGSFDLSLLSLFDEQIGGRIITYLTMSCVNDEAIVNANVSPVPVPSAVWLFGSALIGFIGMSRRTRV